MQACLSKKKEIYTLTQPDLFSITLNFNYGKTINDKCRTLPEFLSQK